MSFRNSETPVLTKQLRKQGVGGLSPWGCGKEGMWSVSLSGIPHAMALSLSTSARAGF